VWAWPLAHREQATFGGSFHIDDAARILADKINERLPPHRSANSYRTSFVDADNAAAIFAYIDTQN
jgi:hypothetical protein